MKLLDTVKPYLLAIAVFLLLRYALGMGFMIALVAAVATWYFTRPKAVEAAVVAA